MEQITILPCCKTCYGETILIDDSIYCQRCEKFFQVLVTRIGQRMFLFVMEVKHEISY